MTDHSARIEEAAKAIAKAVYGDEWENLADGFRNVARKAARAACPILGRIEEPTRDEYLARTHRCTGMMNFGGLLSFIQDRNAALIAKPDELREKIYETIMANAFNVTYPPEVRGELLADRLVALVREKGASNG